MPDFRRPGFYSICAAFGGGKQAQCDNYERGERFCRFTRDYGDLGFACGFEHNREGKEVK